MSLRIVVLLSLLVLAPSYASGEDASDPLERGWYLLSVGRKTDAAAAAASALSEDPTHLEAHRLYQFCWWTMGDRYHLLAQYRSWVQAEPDSEIARIALARLIRLLSHHIDDADEQIQTLLDPIPEDPEARYHALEMRSYYDEQDEDPEARDARIRAMMDAAAQTNRPRLHRRASLMRLVLEPLGRDLADEARAVVLEQPSAMEDLCYILWPDPPAGPHARKLRAFAKREARAALEGNDPARLMSYSFVFYMLNDGAAQQEFEQRLKELEPSYHPWDPSPAEMVISGSHQRFNPDVGLEDLDAIEDEIPPRGPLRARFESTRGFHLGRLDRDDEAHDAYRAAMDAGAEEAHIVLAFANSAANTDRDLELALEHTDALLDRLHIQDFDHDGDMAVAGLGGWTDHKGRRIAYALHTRHHLLRDLDRDDEALSTLLQACALADRPEDHEHLADHYDALDRPAIAFEHRLRAAALRQERTPDYHDHDGLPEDLVTGYATRPYWHHAGLEGFLADRVTALGEENRKAPKKRQPRMPSGEHHPLLGQVFPDLEYSIAKREHRLSDHRGLILLQLWNPG